MLIEVLDPTLATIVLAVVVGVVVDEVVILLVLPPLPLITDVVNEFVRDEVVNPPVGAYGVDEGSLSRGTSCS